MADFKSALPFQSQVTPIAAPNYQNLDVEKMAANPAQSDYDRVMQAMIAEQRKKKMQMMNPQMQPQSPIGAPSWTGATASLMQGK